MIRLATLTFVVLFFLSACSGGSDSSPTATTQPTLLGSVDVLHPASGSIIYSESILVEGTSGNIGDDGFQIRLIAPDDSVLAESNVQPADNGGWSVEIVHEYQGEPTEVTVVASANADTTLDYDIESIALAPLDMRPEGTFGSIIAPQNGDQVGGDSILVTGRGSGFFENTFILSLVNAEGEIAVEIPATLRNPNFIDDMYWEAEIPREGFLGNGSIRMSYQDMESGDINIVDEVEVVVSSVAG